MYKSSQRDDKPVDELPQLPVEDIAAILKTRRGLAMTWRIPVMSSFPHVLGAFAASTKRHSRVLGRRGCSSK
jgi:hypothetical protein